jgi:hypothetical protein
MVELSAWCQVAGEPENEKSPSSNRRWTIYKNWFISSVTWQSFEKGSMVLRPRITTGLLLSEIVN